MKSSSTSLRLPVLLSFAASSVAAFAQAPPLPPRVGVTHQSVADTFTPPASAIVLWPDQMLSQARFTATSAEEQAVSTDTAGPFKSKR